MEKHLTQKVAKEYFKNKTIRVLKVEGCNQMRFKFTDGTEAVLHIEQSYGLPDVTVCDEC